MRDFYTQDDCDKLADLRDNYEKLGTVCLLVYDGETLVGWSVGESSVSPVQE